MFKPRYSTSQAIKTAPTNNNPAIAVIAFPYPDELYTLFPALAGCVGRAEELDPAAGEEAADDAADEAADDAADDSAEVSVEAAEEVSDASVDDAEVADSEGAAVLDSAALELSDGIGPVVPPTMPPEG